LKTSSTYTFGLFSLSPKGVVLILFFSVTKLFAQVGGRQSFSFLNIPQSARLAGLGGVNVSLADRDVNFFYSNPALNGDTLAGVASASYQFYVANIGNATATYARNFRKAGMFTFGVQHLNYGTIKGYDPSGTPTADYSASETAIVIGKSHQIKYYRLGASLKTIFSNLAGYRATAMAFDLGGTFIHPNKLLTVGLVIKNAGIVLSDYAASKSKLPFDVQLGTTFKPQHMPFRFSLTAHHLTQADITYTDPDIQNHQNNTVKKVLSHVNFGSEILLHKNVNVLLGYNFMNHQALKLVNAGGGAGITMGFSANVSNVDFVFSRMAYVAGKAGYTFTLSTRLNRTSQKG
jgi:hypothetical protein